MAFQNRSCLASMSLTLFKRSDCFSTAAFSISSRSSATSNFGVYAKHCYCHCLFQIAGLEDTPNNTAFEVGWCHNVALPVWCCLGVGVRYRLGVQVFHPRLPGPASRQGVELRWLPECDHCGGGKWLLWQIQPWGTQGRGLVQDSSCHVYWRCLDGRTGDQSEHGSHRAGVHSSFITEEHIPQPILRWGVVWNVRRRAPGYVKL